MSASASADPPPRHSRLGALPLLVVTALYAWVGAWPIAVAVGVALGVPIFLNRRAAVPVNAQRIIAAASLGVGIALGLLHTPTPGFGAGTLPSGASAAVVGALLVAAPRLYMTRPGLGYVGTIALGTLALVGCGATRSGLVYGTVAIFFVAFAMLAMKDDDRDARARWSELAPRERVALALMLTFAGAIATASARALPQIHAWSEARFAGAFEIHSIGFSPQMRLGSIERMLASEEIVLRMSGPRADYLRGGVYDHYRFGSGQWVSDTTGEARTIDSAPTPPTGAEWTRVVRAAGMRGRYFVPLGARAFGTRGSHASVDSNGIVMAVKDTMADDYWYALGDRDELGISAPRAADLGVPPSMRAPLERLASEWTAGASGDREKVERIVRHLAADYTYSLDFKRGGSDPLLEFLLVDKRGHCEYFASALALVSRAAHVPARVVAGYRVAERVPLTGHYIVREKNAHAWVEAYIVGVGWRTFDATPTSELFQNLPHLATFASTLTDFVQTAWAFIIGLTLTQILIALAVLVPLFLVVRLLRRRRRGASRGAGILDQVEGPLECLVTLLDALARRGVSRSPSEPLSRFATRVEGAGYAAAADLVAAYSALRYGGVGDVGKLRRAMEGCADEVRRGGGVPRADHARTMAE